MGFAPYIDRSDDLLASACQVSIFFSLLSSVVTSAWPDDATMAWLLPLLLVVPALFALLFETPLLEWLRRLLASADAAGEAAGEAAGQLGQSHSILRRLIALRAAATRRLDAALGNGRAAAPSMRIPAVRRAPSRGVSRGRLSPRVQAL